MPNQYRRDKANGPKPKPDLPHDAIPGIQHAIAKLAGVAFQDISHPSRRDDALEAREAMIVALADCNFRYDEIAVTMACDRTAIYRRRKEWRAGEPTKVQSAVHAEVQRLIEKAMQPERKTAALFVQPGQPIPLPVRRQRSAREMVQAEMRRREASRQRLEADGGGLRQCVD